MLADLGPPGSLDDQMRLRVHYLAADAATALGSVETLFAGTESWTLLGATGLLPPDTRHLRIEVGGRFRAPPDNDAYADDVSLWLREAEDAGPHPGPAAPGRAPRRHAAGLGDRGGACASLRALRARGWRPRPRPARRPDHPRRRPLRRPCRGAGGSGIRDGRDYQVVSSTTTGAVHRFDGARPRRADPLRWIADNQEGYQRFATHLEHLQPGTRTSCSSQATSSSTTTSSTSGGSGGGATSWTPTTSGAPRRCWWPAATTTCTTPTPTPTPRCPATALLQLPLGPSSWWCSTARPRPPTSRIR